MSATEKLCPNCGKVWPILAKVCTCGHHFDLQAKPIKPKPVSNVPKAWVPRSQADFAQGRYISVDAPCPLCKSKSVIQDMRSKWRPGPAIVASAICFGFAGLYSVTPQPSTVSSNFAFLLACGFGMAGIIAFFIDITGASPPHLRKCKECAHEWRV